MLNGLCYLNSLDKSFSNRRDVCCIITMFINIAVFNKNSVDLDQTPRSVASDLSIHCLSMSLLRGANFK